MQSKWIAHQTESTSHKINLLCIPYAGASANIFGEWKKIFPEEYGIFPMLFPMRETRFADPMPDTLKELAETFVNETPELFQKPVVIFGHCTGAVVAYEIALAMKRILHCEPAVLIVSSSNAPDSIPEEMKRLASASDAGLAEYLKSEKQIDSDMLEDEDFTDYYFPLIREDFRLCAEYRVPEAEMLNCPVIICMTEKFFLNGSFRKTGFIRSRYRIYFRHIAIIAGISASCNIRKKGFFKWNRQERT